MTEIILVGIISATSALLGVCITQRYELRKRESEERRWYADYFLGRKIDALNNLHATLFDCYFTMNFYGNCSPSTLQEFKEKPNKCLKIDCRISVNFSGVWSLNKHNFSVVS